MSRLYIFADEAGDFAFKRGPNISRYFMVCTISLRSCDIGDRLLELRRKLIWDRYKLGDFFHATTDTQETRDEVFKLILASDLNVQATLLEKSKAQPQVRITKDRFYKYGWLYHFKYVAPKIITKTDNVLITAASIGTKKGQTVFTEAINDVIYQILVRNHWRTAFWPAHTDPCLQIADYCAWAIQRKWERQDSRSYDLIRHLITHEADMWGHGTHHHY